MHLAGTRVAACLALAAILALQAAAPGAQAAGQPAAERAEALLKALGVEAPFLRGHADLRLELEVRDLKLRPLAVGGRTYLSLWFEGCELMSYPGKPALPFSVRVLRLPAGEGVVVGVLDAEFELMTAPFKVVPAPQPVPYGHAAAELVVAEDPSVYASHGFFPGRLLEYVWDRVGDGIVVVVRVYPVQYNPAAGQLLVVRKLELGVRVVDPAEAPAGGGGVFKGSAVIIAPRSLAAEAYELARVYECYGVNATVVTTEWIRETYPEAENITAYPGFYTYNGTDPVYAELVESYDWDLALRIVSYLRDSAAHPDLRYVVLLGGASSVPPSFYYFHEPSANISWWDAWVPTDFFYASPDYDLVPDYVVGRIPFSDPADVSAYVGKLRRWCVGVCLARDVSWARNVVLAGGYPFLTWFMFGESLISTMSLEGHLDFFNATVLSGTGGSYNPGEVKRAFLEGNASWYLLVSHGTGRSLTDYAFVEPGVFVLEELVDAGYVLELGENDRVPVVSSPSCRNGAWDEELLGAFQPFEAPSFGEAVLLSRGAGVAYLGSSRTSWELPVAVLEAGLLKVAAYGAAGLHAAALEAYAGSMVGDGYVPLGEVVYEAYVRYLGRAEGPLALITLLGTALLGDPLVPLPTFGEPLAEEGVTGASPFGPAAEAPASVVSQLGWGTVPVYDVPGTGYVEVGAFGDSVEVEVVRVYKWFPGSLSPYDWMLLGYEILARDSAPVVGGSAVYGVGFSKDASGLLMLKARAGVREARLYLIAAGLVVSPGEAPVGGAYNVTVEGWGLDVLCGSDVSTGFGVYGVDLGGWLTTTVFPDWRGYFRLPGAPSPVGPGAYALLVRVNAPWFPAVYAPLLDVLRAELTVVEHPELSELVEAVGRIEVGVNATYAGVESLGRAVAERFGEVAAELEALRLGLMSAVAALRSLEAELEAAAEAIASQLSEVNATLVGRLAGSTEAILAELANSTAEAVAAAEEVLDELLRTREALALAIGAVPEATSYELREDLEALASVVSDTTSAVEGLVAELRELVRALARDLGRGQLEIYETINATKRQVTERLAELEALLAEVEAALAEGLERLGERLSERIGSAETRLAGVIEEARAETSESVGELSRELRSSVDEASRELARRLDELEARIAESEASLRSRLALVEKLAAASAAAATAAAALALRRR